MNCLCGNPLSKPDEIESERWRTGTTKCAECRFIYLQFHELEAEPDVEKWRKTRNRARAMRCIENFDFHIVKEPF